MIIVRRFLSGLTDCLFLGSYIFSICFSLFQLDLISDKDPLLAVLAFSGPLLYWTVLESGYGGGASLGKRLFGLMVVDRDGNAIPFYMSALRALVKVGVPAVVLLFAVHLMFGHPVTSGALFLTAVLTVPSSFVMSKGAAGVDDLIARTVVVRKGTEPAVSRQRLWMWLTPQVAVCALAFLTSTVSYRAVFGSAKDAATDLARSGLDAYGPMLAAITLEANNADLSRFVRNVDIRPGLRAFPDELRTSPSRSLRQWTDAFRNQMPVASIEIEMTLRGYDSEIARIQLLERLLPVVESFLQTKPGSSDFVWVNLYTKQTFGILQVSKGSVEALTYQARPGKDHRVDMAIVEPDENTSNYFNLILIAP